MIHCAASLTSSSIEVPEPVNNEAQSALIQSRCSPASSALVELENGRTLGLEGFEACYAPDGHFAEGNWKVKVTPGLLVNLVQVMMHQDVAVAFGQKTVV